MAKNIHIHIGSKTKDAGIDENKYKAILGNIFRDLTDVSRTAGSLRGAVYDNPELKSKAQKLEDLVDAARAYCNQIR